MKIIRDEPLAKHTYFKIGGPAKYFAEAYTQADLVEAIKYAAQEHIPYLVIGGGSNLLISDSGFDGLIIKNKTSRIQLKGFAGGVAKGKVDLKEVLVEAESGVPANLLIRYCLEQGLAGLENMLGLPGSVGGAVYNNSHHLDKLWGDHIVEVLVVDQFGNQRKYKHEDLQFAYDYSILQKTKETVLTATFQLVKGDKNALWEIANAAIKRRASTQPLGKPSSGCMFKNLSLADKMRLGIPTSSAGYLIDKSGLKGLRVGGASVSDVHANFIVNDGTATATDVLNLVNQVKKIIKEKHGVDLELEVFVIGQK